MKPKPTAPRDIDEYIAGFAEDVQDKLEKIRATIHKAAPDVQETISYEIPTFTLNGKYLIYFAAYKKHIAVYPAPKGVEKFKKDVELYGSGKGTLKFPLDQRIPYGLITRIVRFRVKENMAKAKPTASSTRTARKQI